MINGRDMLTKKLIITPPLILNYLDNFKQHSRLDEYLFDFQCFIGGNICSNSLWCIEYCSLLENRFSLFCFLSR